MTSMNRSKILLFAAAVALVIVFVWKRQQQKERYSPNTRAPVDENIINYRLKESVLYDDGTKVFSDANQLYKYVANYAKSISGLRIHVLVVMNEWKYARGEKFWVGVVIGWGKFNTREILRAPVPPHGPITQASRQARALYNRLKNLEGVDGATFTDLLPVD